MYAPLRQCTYKLSTSGAVAPSLARGGPDSNGWNNDPAQVVPNADYPYRDGFGSTERAPEHSWTSPGFYRVDLTVSGLGVESTASRVILVRA